MPFGKSIEEKEAERAEKERKRAEAARLEAEMRSAAENAAARERFLASPVGRATTAKESGQRFFEIQLVVGTTEGTSSWLNGDSSNTTPVTHADTLTRIEDVGWRLEHVGYVYIITREASRDRGFSSGENTAVSGQTIGIYLFRNRDAVPGGVPAARPGSS